MQVPRVSAAPDYWQSSGSEVVEVAALAGLHLDPWEIHVVEVACGLREDGMWAAFQVGVDVPRQNGKGSILEARELTGAFAFEERLIVHSAHEQATSSEHFRRLLQLIESVPEFDQRVLKVVRGKGSEAIELRDGQRILFKTRTGGGGRGFTGDLVVLDEAMIIPDSFMAALVPTMAARSMVGNPQLWLVGSAVDQLNSKHDGIPFARLRKRALAGTPRTAWMEWSIDAKDPSDLTTEQMADPQLWALANPGLGIRISLDYIKSERDALGPREFAVERLGVGDWPDPDLGRAQVIDLMLWMSRADRGQITPPIGLAFDMSPDRARGAIGLAGRRDDERVQVELVEHGRNPAAWIVEKVTGLAGRNRLAGPVVCDASGPAASLIPELTKAGIEVHPVTGREHAQACGMVFDAVTTGTLAHLNDQALADAVAGARKRKLGDTWGWDRVGSDVDISPLVAITLALWGLDSQPPPARTRVINLEDL